jgi:hypothetical protein
MKTRFLVCVALLAVLCTAGQTAFAQYPGMPYAYPVAAAGAPVIMPNGMAMAPVAMPAMPATVAPVSAHTLAPPAAPGPLDAKDGDCDTCKGDGKSCGKDGCCGHCVEIYGEFLFLRPRDAEVAYAVGINGPIVPVNIPTVPIQITPVGVADMDYQPAFRFGFNFWLNSCNAIGASYTRFEGSTSDHLEISRPDVIRSIVSHPATGTAAQDWLEADADLDHAYDIIDVNYTNLFYSDCTNRLSVLAGVRLTRHEQQFQADFAGTGTERVETDIDFYGAGARLGVDFERYLTCQWVVYAKGTGSLLGGEFDAHYRQTQSYDPDVVDTSWEAGRLVGIWDLELGTSWISKCGFYRANVGYVYSAWTNAVQTDEWIQGVRANHFVDMDSTMTYDGLVARLEVRF